MKRSLSFLILLGSIANSLAVSTVANPRYAMQNPQSAQRFEPSKKSWEFAAKQVKKSSQAAGKDPTRGKGRSD